MFVSGLIMVTRNRCVHIVMVVSTRPELELAFAFPCRYLAWPCLLLSINSVINSHPLRVKEGSQAGVSVIMYVLRNLIPLSRVLTRCAR